MNYEAEFMSKNLFTNNFIIDIFVFIIAIISVISTIISSFKEIFIAKQQQAKEVKAEEINEGNQNCECTAKFYVILALSVIIIGLVVFAILQVRRIKLCRG